MGSLLSFILGLFLGAIFTKPLYALFAWIKTKILGYINK